MAQEREPLGQSEDSADFVPAVLARGIEEAEKYRALLDDHDIPAILGTDEELDDMADEDRRLARLRGMTHGVPVLVPESLLDEASEIISDREAFGTFPGEEDEFEDEDDDEDDELHLTSEDDDLDLDVEDELDEDDNVYDDTEDEDEDDAAEP